VPVFYSIFDDLAEMRVFAFFNRLGGRLFGGMKKRLATAATSIVSKS